MDIRWLLCLAYTTMITSDCYLQSVEDNLTDSMHNYTNLKIFLWSGSGDGPDEPTKQSTAAAATTTTTVVPFYSENPEDCIGGRDCNIQPTTVAPPHPGVIDVPQTAEIPDEQYWIVTELDARWPVDVNAFVPAIRDKLAVLYALAFARQRARQVELNATGTREGPNLYQDRRRDADEKPIKVKVHVLSVLNGLDLVYFVSVDGRLVPAATAVRDMSLVTTQEVVDRLGYAVIIKARPYLNGLHSKRARDVSHSEIWIFVAAACTITLILLATGVAVAHKKKKRKNSVNSDRTNMAFCEDQTARRDVKTEATSTEDISTMRTPEPKPRNRSKISNSLLSMEAANKFQKDSIPGPLTNVLDGFNLNENKNVRTLTRHESIGVGQDPGVVGPVVWDLHCKQMQIKNNGQDNDSCSSFDAFNAMDTNVTNMRQKFHELLDDAFTLFGSRNPSSHSEDSSPSISNNEQRSKSAPFRCSATSGGGCPSGRPKTSSAVDSDGGRTDSDHQAAGSCWAAPEPGEAWAGSDQSVFVPRPLSAGPFHRPTIRPEFVTADASLSPQDPAVPLIQAIRDELDRLPSPDRHHRVRGRHHHADGADHR